MALRRPGRGSDGHTERSTTARPLPRAAASPARLVRILAVIAWPAWALFLVALGLGGTPQRGLGAVSFVTAIVACVAFCGLHAWQTRLVRRLALTCAVAAYGYSALAYVFAVDAAARFPSLYDTGLFAFYALTLVWLVQFITDQRLNASKSVWLDAAALSACAAAVGSALLEPALGSDPSPGAVGNCSTSSAI